MQPRFYKTADPSSFARLRKRVQYESEARRGLNADPAYSMEIPGQIGIKLNNACNLRCTHCFEWNEEGYHHGLDREHRLDEIPISIIKDVLAATRSTQSPLYLWGGEPLAYRNLGELCSLLKEDSRWTTICTNGTLLNRHVETLLPISQNLALLVSLEGLGRDNDAIRGEGVFEKVLTQVKDLISLKARGLYHGTVSIGLTINDHVVGKLAEFVQFFESLEVDAVYLVFPWFIPGNVAASMDRFAETVLLGNQNGLSVLGNASWHSFTYHLNEELIELLKEDMRLICARAWRTRVRFHPALEPSEVDGFVRGSPVAAEGKCRCTSIARRLDVLPNGDVVSCKFFPETKMGNLRNQTVLEVWKGSAFRHFREALAGGLSPVCSKCTLLYTTG
jgi:radical SAM protein with 4Fe4S-binding SPASM domain